MKEKLLNHKANLRVMSKFPRKIRHAHTHTHTRMQTHTHDNCRQVLPGKMSVIILGGKQFGKVLKIVSYYQVGCIQECNNLL